MRMIECILGELEAKHKGEFRIERDGTIRHKTMRAHFYSVAKRMPACPLNVLCEGKFKNGDIAEMKDYLGIDEPIGDFLSAADGDDTNNRHADEYRQRLLALCS